MRQSSMRCQTVNSVQLQQIPRTYILVSMSPVSWWRMTNVPLSKQCYKMHCFKSKLLFDWAMGGLMTFSFVFQHKRKLRNSWVVPLTWFHRQSRSPKWSRCFLWPLLLLFSFFIYVLYNVDMLKRCKKSEFHVFEEWNCNDGAISEGNSNSVNIGSGNNLKMIEVQQFLVLITKFQLNKLHRD